MRLLIAEDDRSLQLTYEILMAVLEYEFVIVSNGKEAVEQVLKSNGLYDLCLMDINMPVMDGYKAAKMIRKEVKYLPLLAISGNSNIKERYKEAGFDDYLEKPIEPTELVEKINQLMVHTHIVLFENEQVFLFKEKPATLEHAKILITLKSKNLCEMHIRRKNNHASRLIVHKNVPIKIFRDLTNNNEASTSFLNRSKDNPTECSLYQPEGALQIKLLTEKEYRGKCDEEDAYLNQIPFEPYVGM